MTQPKIIIGAGVMLAAIAGFMTLAHLKSLSKQQVVEGPATRRIVVAARPLKRGQAVEADWVKLVEWPEEAVPEGSFASIEGVLGQLARSEIFADDVLTEAKFLDTKAPSALSGLIPNGRRAISVHVNEVTGIAGFVAPGSHIDLLLTIAAIDDTPPRTLTIVQDVEVLAIAQSIDNTSGQARVVPTVTLNVTPRQAETIALAINEGNLHMVMRNDRDSQRSWTGGANLAQVMGTGTSTRPGSVVELIRGIEKVAVNF